MNRNARRLLIVLTVLALVAVPVAALGGSVFDDVDDDSIFINDIIWMKDNRITRGCNPPANTDYCPKEFVTREQMAAFMHRLGTTFSSKTGATAFDSFLFDPADGNPRLLASLTGFNVPVDGGVVTAHANIIAEPDSGIQLGMAWIVIGGNGTCPNPITSTGWGAYLTADTIVDTTSAIANATVPETTSLRIDLCTAGFGTDTTVLSGALNATWVAEESTAQVAAGTSRTWQEILEPYADAFDRAVERAASGG